MFLCCLSLGSIEAGATPRSSVAIDDSLRLPNRLFGRIFDSTSTSNFGRVFDKKAVRGYQYESLADLLRQASPFVPMRVGGMGQYDAVSVFGAGPRELSVGVDGRDLHDVWSKQFQLALVPVVTIETAEFLFGTDAIGLAPVATSTFLNLQTSVYNTATPFMSLWYHQGAGDMLAANVVYSQNVASGLNFTANIRRAGARGRYDRTSFDQWNVDLFSRYTIDSHQSLLVRYGVSTQSTQVWGGIDTTQPTSPFEETTPVAFAGLRSLDDEPRRHDLSVAYLRTLSDDGRSSLMTQVYLSSMSMHRVVGSELARVLQDSSGIVHSEGQRYGAIVRFDRQIGSLRLRIGTHVHSSALDSSALHPGSSVIQPELFLHTEYRLRSSVAMRLAARVHSVNDSFALAFGWGLSVQKSRYTLRADLSLLQQEASPLQSLRSLLPERHVLAVLEGSTEVGPVDVSVSTYFRTIDDAIVGVPNGSQLLTFTNGTQRRVLGLVGSMPFTVGGFRIRPQVRYQQDVSANLLTPSSFLLLDCRVAYQYQTTRSSITVGVEGSWMASSQLPQYYPLQWAFRTSNRTTAQQFDGLAAFAHVTVGNASIRASYENIFGNRWATVENMPELIRVFRLSIDWSFID